MRDALGIDERERYATQLADLWTGLSTTLLRLEAIAGSIEHLDDEVIETLPLLQYRLHLASEIAAGIDPPVGTAEAHGELARALADARDATGEVVEAFDRGGRVLAAVLVHQWRGALFNVRLARHRLAAPPRLEFSIRDESAPLVSSPAALAVASVLSMLAGTACVTAGAALSIWPLWLAGLAVAALGLILVRH